MATLKIGVLVSLERDPRPELAKVRELGLDSCQLCCWDPEVYAQETAARARKAADELGVEITSLWAGYPGPAHWDFREGPSTIGFVPAHLREMRVAAVMKGVDFASWAGFPSVTTHAGFIPENPADPVYRDTMLALRKIAAHCQSLGLWFCLETGQETPTTLLRLIQDIGTGNVGVNLDPANLLMYGKANPLDALDIIGKYVRGVHAKDGEYPTEPMELGVEKPLGQGRVNFPALVAKLKALGYEGALTIEREITGDQQIADIRNAVEVLRPLC